MGRYNIGFINSGGSLSLIANVLSKYSKIGGVSTYQDVLTKTLITKYNYRFHIKILHLDNIDHLFYLDGRNYEVILAKNRVFHHEFLRVPYSHFIAPIERALLAKRHLQDTDIVHINNFSDGGLIKSLNPEIKIVYTIHGRILPRNSLYHLSPYYKIVDKFSYWKMKNGVKGANAIITVDSAMDSELYSLANKYKKKIILIPNGVNVEKFNPQIDGSEIREKYNIPEDATVIISTSRFAYQRRIEMLIKAFSRLSKKYDNIYLLIVGDGPRKNEFINMVKSLKIEKRVIFTGSIPNWDLPKYYAAADIGFNSFTDVPAADAVTHTHSLNDSIKKAHPISISFSTLEALASGLPVVAVVKNVKKYRNLRVEEIKDDSGIIVPRNKLETLTIALEMLITHPDIRNSMGENARDIAVKKRNIETMMRKTVKVYQQVLEN